MTSCRETDLRQRIWHSDEAFQQHYEGYKFTLIFIIWFLTYMNVKWIKTYNNNQMIVWGFLLIIFVLFCFVLDWFIWKAERESKGGGLYIPFTGWLFKCLQSPEGPGQGQEPPAPFCSSTWVAGTKYSGCRPVPPGCIIRQLGQKQ